MNEYHLAFKVDSPGVQPNRWIASLSNGETVFQNVLPGRQHAWIRLSAYLRDHQLYITSLRLHAYEHKITMPKYTEVDGYWYMEGGQFVLGAVPGVTDTLWSGVGYLRDGQIHITWLESDTSVRNEVRVYDPMKKGAILGMQYDSATSKGVKHDAANAITELIFINAQTERNLPISDSPWKNKNVRAFWSKTVSAVKKLMRDFEITPDQLAFYVHRCNPIEIDGVEFAKAAVVAKKLLRKCDLAGLMSAANERLTQIAARNITEGMSTPVPHAQPKRKNLQAFLQELESGQNSEE